MKKFFPLKDFESLADDSEMKNLLSDPFFLFRSWFSKASVLYPDHSNAVILSTAGPGCRPSSRVVLLKGIENDGFVFFTNYLSRKGKELENNPYASLLFFWPGPALQVRIEGMTVRTDPWSSSEYFAGRPRNSKAAAWASAQSESIPDRNFLEKKYRDVRKKFYRQEIPRPDHWGGFRLIPEYFEFWQGRSGRMHDRITYTLKNNTWETGRLSP